MSETAPLNLPPILDLLAAGDLAQELRERIGLRAALEIDGRSVERISTACLQLLTAASRAAKSQGTTISLREPSVTLKDAILDLGLEQDLLS